MMASDAAPEIRHRVLIADDSAFMRKLIGEMVSAEADFEVVGVARDGVEAIAQIRALDPDVVTLDLEMPELDGMQVLEHLLREAPRRVVVLSAGGPQYGDATIRALELGALDFVEKPSGPISLDLPVIRERLIDALRTAVSVDLAKVRPSATSPAIALPALPMATPDERGHTAQPTSISPPALPAHAAHTIVAVAASTGGPRALSEVIPGLPGTLDAAVMIVQHMPKAFTGNLAQRLDAASALCVTEAVDGMAVLGGHVYLAPGDAHMLVARDADSGAAHIRIHPRDAHGGVCPSADVLFESVADLFGAQSVAVVLTGMGRDGSEGTRRIRACGGRAIVQDRETSVIYGMPHAALQHAGADIIVPLHGVAPAIATAVTAVATVMGSTHD